MNSFVNQIYVINLAKDYERRRKCIAFFEKYQITNYQFFNAIDINDYPDYLELYKEVTKEFNQRTILYNYQPGALGCTLSHLACIQDAKEKNYHTIIIFEDDILPIMNFSIEFQNVIKHLQLLNWDFVYLGKKQGSISHEMEYFPNIHTNRKYYYDDNNNSCPFFYSPNYKTWASHALLIKSTIYDALLEFHNILSYGPIDLLLMTLYDSYNFYVCSKDLFITDEYSNICVDKSNIYNNITWNWEKHLYDQFISISINQIILYGDKQSNMQHYQFYLMYYFLFKENYPDFYIHWVDLNDNINEFILPHKNYFLFVHSDYYVNLIHLSKHFMNNTNIYYLQDSSNINSIVYVHLERKLNSIAVQEFQQQNRILYYQLNDYSMYGKIWFVNQFNYHNSAFTKLTNITLPEALIHISNYLIYVNNETNINLINRIISLSNYVILVDPNSTYFPQIIQFCQTYHKHYQYQNNY